MNNNNKHDKLVLDLEEYLNEYFDYDKIWTFREYSIGQYVGEIDLLAKGLGEYDFYEVKCNYHPKSLRKAIDQYHRFQLAFPKWITNGFIFTPQVFKQLR